MEFPAVTYMALSGEGGLACGGLFVPDEMDAVRFLRDARNDAGASEMRRGSEPLIPPVGDLLPMGEGG